MIRGGFRANRGKRRHMKEDPKEQSLAKKLFGNSAGLNDESSSEESSDEEPQIVSTANEGDSSARKQVWHDDDDDTAVVLPTHKRDVHLLRSTDAQKETINAKEYEKRLRERFVHTRGSGQAVPKWATKTNESESRGNDEDSDESDADEVDRALRQMTASTGSYVQKGQLLPKGVLGVSKSVDITRGHRHNNLPMRALEFHPVQHVVMTGSENGTISLFEVGLPESEEHFLQDVHFKGFPISCASFSHDGANIIVGSRKRSYLFSYDLMEGRTCQLRPPCVMANVNCGSFALSADGKRIAVMKRNEVHMLSSSAMEYMHSLTTPTPVTSIQFSPNTSNMLYAMTEGGEVLVWDVRKPDKQRSFMDEGAVRGTVLRVSPNEQFIACGSNTGIVNLYEVSAVLNSRNPKPVQCFDQLTTSAEFLCFNQDSQMLAISSSIKGNAVRMVHIRSRSVFSNFPPRNIRVGQATRCHFSPHSGYFAVGDCRGYLSMFRLNHFDSY